MMIWGLFSVAMRAQEVNELEKIAAILGVNSEEEIPGDEYELLQDALKHPIKMLKLNLKRWPKAIIWM